MSSICARTKSWRQFWTPRVPKAFEYVPELKKAYTSNAGDNTIGVVDLRQMKVIKKIPPKPSRTVAPMLHHSTSFTFLMNEAKRKPSWMSARQDR